MINVAILGHGVVGSGVAEILINNKELIIKNSNQDLFIKYILDLRDFENNYKEKFTKDFKSILNDDTIKIVAEVMGGINPAFDFVKQCLEHGKSVVTSNKELVAEKGYELIKIANSNNVNFLFEASVGGGIPVLHPMIQCLVANEIEEVSGILNGTTNYILNKMIVDDMPFDDALSLAQEKGYAEKNPAADIEGHDACRKICILATLAFGKHVYPNQVETVGITNVTLDDVEYANAFNYVIKLIGSAKKISENNITASVKPTLVGHEKLLSCVNGVFNAVSVKGNATGEVLFYGKGAGKNPTASAVVSDMIECAKNMDTKNFLTWEDGFDGYVVSDADMVSNYYVLIKADDYELLEKEFNKEFSNVKSIKNQYKKEIACIFENITENDLKQTLNNLNCNTDIKIFNIIGG